MLKNELDYKMDFKTATAKRILDSCLWMRLVAVGLMDSGSGNPGRNEEGTCFHSTPRLFILSS